MNKKMIILLCGVILLGLVYQVTVETTGTDEDTNDINSPVPADLTEPGENGEVWLPDPNVNRWQE